MRVKWTKVENTMYGSRPATIYINENKRYRVDLFYPGSRKFMCSQYYSQIPQYIKAAKV